MFMKLIQEIKLLEDLLHDIPTRFHDTLEWNTTEKGVEKQLRFFYPEPVEPKSAEAFVQPTRGHRREQPHKETSARQAPQKRGDIVEIDSEEESYYTESSCEEVEVEGEEDDAGEEPVESPPGLREDADAEMEDATADEAEKDGEPASAPDYQPYHFNEEPRRLNSDRDRTISKRLAVVLRHDKGEFKLPFLPNMTTPVTEVLQLRIMTKMAPRRRSFR